MTLFQIQNAVIVRNRDCKFVYLVGVGSGLGAVTVDLRDLLVLAGDLGLAAAEAVLAGLFFLAGLRPLDLKNGHTFLGLKCINQLHFQLKILFSTLSFCHHCI